MGIKWRMFNEDDLRNWLSSTCPNIWGLLNLRARKSLPKGLHDYLNHKNANMARNYIKVAERLIGDLISTCGSKRVGDAYRRDMSGVSTATQLAEYFCEIAFCAAVGRLSSTLCLRPKSGKGTSCDVSFQLAGATVYGEAKRYKDSLLLTGHPMRSLVKAPGGRKPHGSARPWHMDLISKLRDVPRQFPDGTLNLLFIFNRSLDDSFRCIQQALFGEHTFFIKPDQVSLEEDGLFAKEEWRAISGCCFSSIPQDGSLICPVIWENLRALVPILPQIRAVLDQLNSARLPVVNRDQ